MKSPVFFSIKSVLPRMVAGALMALLFSAAQAQTPVNLIGLESVRTDGTYTYYARGDANAAAVTPFTTMFYPGGSKHSGNSTLYRDNGLDDGASTPGPIGIGSGFLTNLSNAQSVGGWVNIEQLVSGSAGASHEGTFDIVLDLGAVYTITSVEIVYTDIAGYRWSLTADAQAVLTSTAVPVADAGLSVFGTGTAVFNATDSLMSISGTAIDARYVVFRPVMTIGANPNSGLVGGLIDEIRINGYSTIPEPAAWAAVFGGLGFVSALVLKRRKRV